MRSASDEADEVPEREERVHRPVGVEMQRREAEIERRRRHAGETVLAAGEVRQRAELDEVEHLRDRHRDHGEIDAGAAERDQADEIADRGGADHADDERQDDVGEARLREQIGGDHAARAEEGRLAERQKPGEAEQDVEAEAEQAPDQDAVDRRGREAEMGQHEGRDDQADRGQGFDEKGTLLEHGRTGPIRGRPRRGARTA